MSDGLFLRHCRLCGSRVADHLVNSVHPILDQGGGPEHATFRFDCPVCGPDQPATAYFNITCVDCWQCAQMRPMCDPYCSRCGAAAVASE